MLELGPLVCCGWRRAGGCSGPCWDCGPWMADLALLLARRRLELPDLEVEIELGVLPRPARHSDMWAFVLLLVVHKAFGRWSSLNLGYGGRSSLNLGYGGRRLSFSSCGGVGGGRRRRPDAAVNPKDFDVNLSFFRGFPATCTVLRVLLDRICVCTYDVLHLSLT